MPGRNRTVNVFCTDVLLEQWKENTKMKYFFGSNEFTVIYPPPKSIRIGVGAKRQFSSSIFIILKFFFRCDKCCLELDELLFINIE